MGFKDPGFNQYLAPSGRTSSASSSASLDLGLPVQVLDIQALLQNGAWQQGAAVKPECFSSSRGIFGEKLRT